MLLILKAYGIPEELVTAINIMYADTSEKVITPDGETETFSILDGVLQGVAPYIYPYLPHTSLSLLLTIS